MMLKNIGTRNSQWYGASVLAFEKIVVWWANGWPPLRLIFWLLSNTNLLRGKFHEIFIHDLWHAKRMTTFCGADPLYVTVLTGFIKGSTAFSQIVKRSITLKRLGTTDLVVVDVWALVLSPSKQLDVSCCQAEARLMYDYNLLKFVYPFPAAATH